MKHAPLGSPKLLEGANVSPQYWERRGSWVEKDHQTWCYQQASPVSVATGCEGTTHFLPWGPVSTCSLPLHREARLPKGIKLV